MRPGDRRGNLIEIEGDIARVQLVRGSGATLFAAVDLEDLERVMAYTWHAAWNSNTESWHARTNTARDGTPRRTLRLHRFILDAPEGLHVDHRDHDTLNCRRSNLRLADYSENARNRRAFRGSASPYKGVTPDRGRWRAQIVVDGQHIHIGTCGSEEDAARLYDEAARHYFGEFACVNFPEVEPAVDTPSRGGDAHIGPRRAGHP